MESEEIVYVPSTLQCKRAGDREWACVDCRRYVAMSLDIGPLAANKNVRETGHGFYDVGCLDFSGEEIIANLMVNPAVFNTIRKLSQYPVRMNELKAELGAALGRQHKRLLDEGLALVKPEAALPPCFGCRLRPARQAPRKGGLWAPDSKGRKPRPFPCGRPRWNQ